jgi:Kef-type K+ transport system membrane component KefB
MTTSHVLIEILVVVVAAKLAAEASHRLGIPTVAGEILAGVVVGPSVMSVVGEDDVLRVLGQLGVILLLVGIGMEMDISELAGVRRSAITVAVVGVVAPLIGGYLAATAFGAGGETALFVGASLTATSVGITARIFADVGLLSSVEARTVLGAAIADDVIGLVMLTVIGAGIAGTAPSLPAVSGIVAAAVGTLCMLMLVGVRIAPWALSHIHRLSRLDGTPVALSLAFILLFASVAYLGGLAPIIGAFVAGLALRRCADPERIKRELTPIGHLFIPVFFLEIGIAARVEHLMRPEAIPMTAALLVVAVAGKAVAGLGAVRAPGDKLLIGLAMLPRGEVGLVFGALGLSRGVLDERLYGAIVIVVLITTLLAPVLLRARLGTIGRAEGADVQPLRHASEADEWLVAAEVQ